MKIFNSIAVGAILLSTSLSAFSSDDNWTKDLVCSEKQLINIFKSQAGDVEFVAEDISSGVWGYDKNSVSLNGKLLTFNVYLVASKEFNPESPIGMLVTKAEYSFSGGMYRFVNSVTYNCNNQISLGGGNSDWKKPATNSPVDKIIRDIVISGKNNQPNKTKL